MWRLLRRGRPDSDNSAEERLDTWKEIAAYLKRDVRTVQRWEKDEELPVRRHLHNQLPTVYAYRNELDVWWNNRKERLETSRSVFRAFRPLRSMALAVIALLGAAVAWYVWDGFRQPRLSFEERDWLLVAPFENRSGDPLFDRTIQYAFERELANSRFVNVVPRQRIEDALRLMRRSVDTRLDRTLAREICLRDGEIRALLTGRVEKLGGDYVFWAEIVDPALDVTIASWSDTVDDKEQVWPVLHRLARSVRAGLGESIGQIRQDENKLEEVTTPSLLALRLFSEGDILLHQRTHAAAAELFTRALSEDPDFAAAHMWLAWALHNDGRPEQEWLHHVEEAVKLSPHVSEPERLVILAKAHSLRGNKEEAVPLYEALLRLDPDHYWGTNNLTWTYQSLGRLEAHANMLTRFVRLRPTNIGSRYQLAYVLANHRFDFEGAAEHRERTRELLHERGDVEAPWAWGAAWVEMFPVFRNLAENRPAQARIEADAMERNLDAHPEPLRSQVRAQLGQFHLAFGRLSKGRELSALVADPMERLGMRLGIAFLEDNEQEMNRLAVQVYDSGDRLDFWAATALARTGHLREAEETMRLYEETPGLERFELFLKGEIAASRKDFAAAKDSLHRALELMKPRNTSALYLAAGTLARVYREEGLPLRAAQALEEVDDVRRLINPWCGPQWLKTRLQLLELYESAGFEADRVRLEARLREFLGEDPAVVRSDLG